VVIVIAPNSASDNAAIKHYLLVGARLTVVWLLLDAAVIIIDVLLTWLSIR
jgi:hypothetical protein